MKRKKQLYVLHRDKHVSGAINALAEVSGMPWWKAKNIILWRRRKGLAIHIGKVLEPVGES